MEEGGERGKAALERRWRQKQKPPSVFDSKDIWLKGGLSFLFLSRGSKDWLWYVMIHTTFPSFFSVSHETHPKKFDMWHFWPIPRSLPLPNCFFLPCLMVLFLQRSFFYNVLFLAFLSFFCCDWMTDRRWNDSPPVSHHPPKSIRRHFAEGVPDIWHRGTLLDLVLCFCYSVLCFYVFACLVNGVILE